MKKKSNKMKQLARELGTGRGRRGRAGAGRQGYKVTRPLLPEAVAGEGAQVSPLLFLARVQLLLRGLGANDAERLVQPGHRSGAHPR